MKTHWIGLFGLIFIAASCGAYEPSSSAVKAAALEPISIQGTSFRLAGRSESAGLLRADDAYYRQFSPDDLTLRRRYVGSESIESKEDYFDFIAGQALDFNVKDAEVLHQGLQRLSRELQYSGIELLLPDEIILVKTTGLVEFSLPHTRRNFIVVSDSALYSGPSHTLGALLSHELFHVMSRYLGENASERKDALYATIGFERLSKKIAPKVAGKLLLTNPDAPRYEHALLYERDGRVRAGIPIGLIDPNWHGRNPISESQVFFCDLVEGLEQWVVAEKTCDPLAPGRGLPEFWSRVGENTRYIIHPEEILAENFSVLLRALDANSQGGLGSPEDHTYLAHRYPDQEVLANLKEVLQRSD